MCARSPCENMRERHSRRDCKLRWKLLRSNSVCASNVFFDIFRYQVLSISQGTSATTSTALCTEKRERNDDIPSRGPVEARNSRIDDLPLLRNEACICRSNYASEFLIALSKRQHLEIYVDVRQSRDIACSISADDIFITFVQTRPVL